MTTRPDSWQRLVALARTVPETVPAVDAFDDARFAARVVQRWTHHRPIPASRNLPWEAWSLRGLAAAGALAAVMLTWNLPLLSADTPPDDVLPPDSLAELAASF